MGLQIRNRSLGLAGQYWAVLLVMLVSPHVLLLAGASGPSVCLQLDILGIFQAEAEEKMGSFLGNVC